MAQYWSDHQLDRVVPPQVKDLRGNAVIRAVDRLIGSQPVADFDVRDADTCPSAALPALIAEYSMEEFIEPGLSEATIRRILKKAWFLQELAGTDAGVLLGLSLLGIEAKITQWYETEPKGDPNTHNIRISAGEKLFDPEADVFLGDVEVRAAKRMIEACKRFSQGTSLRQEVMAKLPMHRVVMGGRAATYSNFCSRIGQRPSRAQIATVSAASATTHMITNVASLVSQAPAKAQILHEQNAKTRAITITNIHSTQGDRNV